MSKKISVGSYVATYCTKCKLDLGHTIILMEGEQIARVKCRTCGSEHKYREKKKKRVAAKRGTSSVKKEKVSRSPEKLWEAAMMMVEGADIPYDMSKVYSVGDIIDHRTFGKGVVQSTMCKKVGILFKDKERLLVSGNK